MFKFVILIILMIGNLKASQEFDMIAIPRGPQIEAGHFHANCAEGQRGMIFLTIAEYLMREGDQEATCMGCKTPLIPNEPSNTRRPYSAHRPIR